MEVITQIFGWLNTAARALNLVPSLDSAAGIFCILVWISTLLALGLFVLSFFADLGGGDADVSGDLDGDTGHFSVRTIIGFMLGFSWGGFVCIQSGMSTAGSVGVGVLAGRCRWPTPASSSPCRPSSTATTPCPPRRASSSPRPTPSSSSCARSMSPPPARRLRAAMPPPRPTDEVPASPLRPPARRERASSRSHRRCLRLFRINSPSLTASPHTLSLLNISKHNTPTRYLNQIPTPSPISALNTFPDP